MLFSHCFKNVSRENHILTYDTNVIQKTRSSFLSQPCLSGNMLGLWTSPDLENIFSPLFKNDFFKWLFYQKKNILPENWFPEISMIITLWWFTQYSKLNFNINFTQCYKLILHILIGAGDDLHLMLHSNL